jgi:hypothetical protein
VSKGFLTTARTAELFFRYCLRYHIDDPKERVKVLERISKKMKAMEVDNVDLVVKSLRDKKN